MLKEGGISFSDDDPSSVVEELDPTGDLSSYFTSNDENPNPLPKECVHVLVEVPTFDFDTTNGRQVKRQRTDEEERELKSLKIVYKFLWGQLENLEKLKETSSIEIPSLQGVGSSTKEVTFYDLGKIPDYEGSKSLEMRFYLREEYKTFDAFMKTKVDEEERSTIGRSGRHHIIVVHHFLLLGHPGIGKTVYLTYCLLHRLADKMPTCFSRTPVKRYMFLANGVLQVLSSPGDQILFSKYDSKDALMLYDMNDTSRTVTQLDTEWRTLVACSPQVERYEAWRKQLNPKPPIFVMRSWQWEEIYAARELATNGRDQNADKWKEAFTKWGGSVRHLYTEQERNLEDSLLHAAQDANFQKLFSSPNPSEASHHLVMVDPPLLDDGTVNEGLRDILTSRLISDFVFDALWKECMNELVSTMDGKLDWLMQFDASRAMAGIMFESIGHAYIQKFFKTALLEVTSLGKTGHVEHVDLQHVVEKKQFLSQANLPSAQDMQEYSNCYFRPRSLTLPGIDSFALEINGAGIVTGIVMFQFTVSSRHPIDPKVMKLWWTNNKKMKKWEWKLVFIIPSQCNIQMEQKITWVDGFHQKGVLKQYVWKIHTSEMVHSLRSSPTS